MAQGAVRVYPVFETAAAVLAAREIAAAPRVARLAFGGTDFLADIGAPGAVDGPATLAARGALVLASSAAGIAAPVDTVYTNIDDGEGLVRGARFARELGFFGKSIIHPRQIAPVHEVFTPSEGDLAAARRVLAHAEHAAERGEGASAIDGELVDPAVVARARARARAGRGEPSMSRSILEAIDAGLRVFDLSRPMVAGMPQSPNHPRYRMALVRRHGDMVRADGGSAANELIVMGGHVGHAHRRAQPRLAGRPAARRPGRRRGAAGRPLRAARHGDGRADRSAAAVLLDVPAALGVDACPPAQTITRRGPAARRAERAGRRLPSRRRAARAQRLGAGAGTTPRRTSATPAAFPAPDESAARAGSPSSGRGAVGARHDRVRAAARRRRARDAAGRTGVLLVEHGIHIIEKLDLEELAATGGARVRYSCSPAAAAGGRHRIAGAAAGGRVGRCGRGS